MKMKEIDSIKKMSIEEMRNLADSLRKDMFELRMKKIVAPFKNVHLLRNMRKKLAIVLTFLAKKIQVNNER